MAMVESHNDDENFKQFTLQSTWTETAEGWRRERMNGLAVELVNVGNGFYQVIVNRNDWPRDDAPPARVEMYPT